jgi:hypothetical protein
MTLLTIASPKFAKRGGTNWESRFLLHNCKKKEENATHLLKTPPQFDTLLACTYAGESHYLIMSNLLATDDGKAAKSYRCQFRS